MAFIDGENITGRYQELLKKGRSPRDGVNHIPDVFVWFYNSGITPQRDFRRAHYYTSVRGDTNKIEEVGAHIRNQVAGVRPDLRLYPIVVKRGSKGRGTKTVDIRLATDALTQLAEDTFDVLFLYTGDGDFTPVVRAAIRRGKRVVVGAFSTGLSPSLRRSADEVLLLDDYFFWPVSSP